MVLLDGLLINSHIRNHQPRVSWRRFGLTKEKPRAEPQCSNLKCATLKAFSFQLISIDHLTNSLSFVSKHSDFTLKSIA